MIDSMARFITQKSYGLGVSISNILTAHQTYSQQITLGADMQYEPLYVLKAVYLWAKSPQKVKKVEIHYEISHDNSIIWAGTCSVSQPNPVFEVLGVNIPGYDVPFESTTYTLFTEYDVELFEQGNINFLYQLVFAVYGR